MLFDRHYLLTLKLQTARSHSTDSSRTSNLRHPLRYGRANRTSCKRRLNNRWRRYGCDVISSLRQTAEAHWTKVLVRHRPLTDGPITPKRRKELKQVNASRCVSATCWLRKGRDNRWRYMYYNLADGYFKRWDIKRDCRLRSAINSLIKKCSNDILTTKRLPSVLGLSALTLENRFLFLGNINHKRK